MNENYIKIYEFKSKLDSLDIIWNCIIYGVGAIGLAIVLFAETIKNNELDALYGLMATFILCFSLYFLKVIVFGISYTQISIFESIVHKEIKDEKMKR